MAESTGISWCDATMNPWVGCEKVSPGCSSCYAEVLVTGRMGRAGTWGADGTRERTSPSLWKKPLRWNALAEKGRLPDGTENPDGHRPRVFCASLADVFEPRPELEPWRVDLFKLVAATPNLDWLVLTKRPEHARDWLREWYGDESMRDALTIGPREWTSRGGLGWGCLPNLWMGVSIENARHTYRADVLREIPAAVRFVSAEPLLGSLYPPPGCPETRWDGPYRFRCGLGGDGDICSIHGSFRAKPLNLDGIDWIIVGGESGGRDARPMHPAWAREIRDTVLYGTPHPSFRRAVDLYGDPDTFERNDPRRPRLHFKQQGSHDAEGRYVGAAPTSGGCLLDGREWKEFPEVRVAV